MSNEAQTELTKLAAQLAPEFKFASAEITAAPAKFAHLFTNTMESAQALTETVGKAVLGGAASGLVTGMPLVGLAVSTGIALHNVLSGSKKDGPVR
jgi:hypothetical protein